METTFTFSTVKNIYIYIYHFSPPDIDDCVNNNCSSGGSCIDGINNFTCKCNPGFTGDRCQTGVSVSCYQHSFILLPLSLILFSFALFLS